MSFFVASFFALPLLYNDVVLPAEIPPPPQVAVGKLKHVVVFFAIPLKDTVENGFVGLNDSVVILESFTGRDAVPPKDMVANGLAGFDSWT